MLRFKFSKLIFPMRRFRFALICSFFTLAAASQTVAPDVALVAKTRALYDAPFSRGLISFDCAIQFDWREHFTEVLGSLPAAAAPTVERLQALQHRLFVDRSGAVVSTQPKAPELTSVPKASDLEQVFDAMIPQGLDAWLPFSTNVILPVNPTKSSFTKIDSGYEVNMSGAGVEATLLLNGDLRLTSAVSKLPRPMRFTTEFTNGPDGFLLHSVKTAPTTDPSAVGEATFAYTYQTVEGFQLPSAITITPATTEVWRYSLSDCKVVHGTILEVGLPVKP